MTAAVVSSQPAESAAPASESGAAAESSNPLDLDLLLADPVEGRPGFEMLRNRLLQVAEGTGTPADFERAAQVLAAEGIYTTAIQLLWFAEQTVSDKQTAAGYRDSMKVWAQAATAADLLLEEGEQLYVAGRKKEALASFLGVTEAHPFSERAHFRLADAWRRIYEEEYGNDLSLAPVDLRVRVFRDAYEHYRLALEIDPLFYDAYYGLSELRGMLPDNQEFLLRTQPLTQRALDFRGEVVPVLEAIETGEEDGSVFSRLAEALERIGAREFAVFACQSAIQLGVNDAEVSSRLDALRDQLRTGEGTRPTGGR